MLQRDDWLGSAKSGIQAWLKISGDDQHGPKLWFTKAG